MKSVFPLCERFTEMGDVPHVTTGKGRQPKVHAEIPAYEGARSISRALQLLRLVAQAGETGLRLRDAAAQTQLNASTVHRMLAALVSEGAIARDPLAPRYRLGPEFLHLMDKARDANLTKQYGEVIRFVAAKTGDSTYLSVPAGTDVVCVARVIGASAIQPIPFDIGGRRAFGVGAAGIVALASMPERRIQSILAHHAPAFQHYGLTPADIAPLVLECRKTGSSYNPGLFIKGVSGLGVPITNPAGTLIGVLNIVALNTRLQSESIRQRIVTLMRDAIKRASESIDHG